MHPTCSSKTILLFVCLILITSACATQPKPIKKHITTTTTQTTVYEFEGNASWYGRDFQGKRTASGERFNMHAMTAAHRTLPFGTEVEVTYPTTGKSTKVRINDRGPYSKKRVIDLSYAAAKAIGLIKAGHGWVVVRVLEAD